jgi:transcriptional regulator
MYDLPYFKENDREVLLEFMRTHRFATLIGAADAIPAATQVPFLIDDRDGQLFLRGHMMRNSDHHRAFQKNGDALCLFSGAHTYVSARWYSNPQTGSTWNYMSVHARGKLRFLGEPELLAILEEMTALFENDDDSPALFRHLPKGYVDALAKAITGFEVAVEDLDGVFKLSQNRDRESYGRIMQELRAQGGDGAIIAEEMRQREGRLFARAETGGDLT